MYRLICLPVIFRPQGYRLLLLVLLLSPILPGQFGWANSKAPEATEMQETPTLFIVTESFPPFQIIEDNQQIGGFATEVIREVLKRSGYRFNISVYPWHRAYHQARKKANTCIYSIARSEPREADFAWIGPVTELKTNSIFISLNNDKTINMSTLDDAKHYLTAVIRNDFIHEALLESGFEEGKNLYVVDNTNSLLKLLISRQGIDMIIVDELTFNYRVNKYHLNTARMKQVYKLSQMAQTLYFACSRNTDRKIVANLRQIMSALHQDGSYQGIVSKWQQQLTITP